MFQTGLIWTGVERYRKFLKNLLFEQGKDVKVGPIKQKKKKKNSRNNKDMYYI